MEFIKKYSEDLKSKHYPLVVMSAAHDNFPDILTDIMKLCKMNHCARGLSAALCGGGHERCVQILLENGGSAYDKNGSGHLVFHNAALWGRAKFAIIKSGCHYLINYCSLLAVGDTI